MPCSTQAWLWHFTGLREVSLSNVSGNIFHRCPLVFLCCAAREAGGGTPVGILVLFCLSGLAIMAAVAGTIVQNWMRQRRAERGYVELQQAENFNTLESDSGRVDSMLLDVTAEPSSV